MSGGTKHDGEKPLLALIPPLALWEVGKAFTVGKQKYGQANWTKGLEVIRLISGGLRHVFQFLMGEDLDKETGVHHLGCACANFMMAHDMTKLHPDKDDRYEYKSKNS